MQDMCLVLSIMLPDEQCAACNHLDCDLSRNFGGTRNVLSNADDPNWKMEIKLYLTLAAW
jgi:hypothetical protein